jgi:hypothetical protein
MVLLAGCSGSDVPQDRQNPTRPPERRDRPAAPVAAAKPSDKAGDPKPKKSQGLFQEPEPASPNPPSKGPAKPPKRRSLADLLEGDPKTLAETPDYLVDPPDGASRMVPEVPRMQIDQQRVAAAGIRRIEGKHLTLYTDLPPGPEVDGLPGIFDQAFPQWCEYLKVKAADHADWHLSGVLIKDKARFKQAGLMPDNLPPFPHGYARNHEFWLYEQPSDYYRRHLLLHEGTHGFMITVLGSCGPPWYMEGIAELLATHRWQDGRLTLDCFPASREEVPMWGRIKIVKDAYAAGKGKRLRDVIEYSRYAHRENDAYGWCWAAAAFLDGHPRYQERFRQLPKLVVEPDFSERFYKMFADDWEPVCEEWELFVATLQYGYDLRRTMIDFTPGGPLPAAGTTVKVAAELGWQQSGIRLEAGAAYRLVGSGRYQVADKPQVWWCEPNGVSIRYVDGQPLGILLAAVRPEGPRPDQPSPLLHPLVVGLGGTLVPKQSGTLYLRINDSPGELADNAGTLSVRIEREKAAAVRD